MATVYRFSRGLRFAICLEEKEVMEWKKFPAVDEDGYFFDWSLQGVGEGMGLADFVVETPLPEGIDLTKNYVRWTGSEWVVEPKPTTPAECVALGPVSHQSTTARCNELRKLYEELTKGSEDYRLERGENLEWIVVKIPQEEKDAQQAEAAISDFDSQTAALKDRLATAMLQDDEQQVASLKAEYKALMNGGV